MEEHQVEFAFFSPSIGEDIAIKGIFNPVTNKLSIEKISILSEHTVVGEINHQQLYREALEEVRHLFDSSYDADKKMESGKEGLDEYII